MLNDTYDSAFTIMVEEQAKREHTQNTSVHNHIKCAVKPNTKPGISYRSSIKGVPENKLHKNVDRTTND